jgi:hypothetical protein
MGQAGPIGGLYELLKAKPRERATVHQKCKMQNVKVKMENAGIAFLHFEFYIFNFTFFIFCSRELATFLRIND